MQCFLTVASPSEKPNASRWHFTIATLACIHIATQRRVFLLTPLKANFLPVLSLDDSEGPMYRQLYDWFRLSIADGQLRPGQRVPSTRSLAAELNISRIPVFNAYEQLCSEGYLETFVGAGTCVAKSIPDDFVSSTLKKGLKSSKTSNEKRPARHISDRARALSSMPAQPWLNSSAAFRVSLPAIDHFPIRVWSKLVARHARTLQPEIMAYGDAMGPLSGTVTVQ